EEFAHPVGPHPSPAVPLRAAVAQPYAVHHAGAGEPVIGRGVLVRQRVRADAEQPAGQLARDRPRDAELVGGDLLAYRREVPCQVAVGRVRHRDVLLRRRVAAACLPNARALGRADRTPSISWFMIARVRSSSPSPAPWSAPWSQSWARPWTDAQTTAASWV